MSRPAAVAVCVAALLLLGAAAIGAQDSRCGDCHLANPDAPEAGI